MNHHDCNCEFEGYGQEASDIVDEMTDSEVIAKMRSLCPKSYETIVDKFRDKLKEALFNQMKYNE